MSRNAPQLPISNTTGNAISVLSTAGFSQGDLIYSKNGDAGTIPNNALSSALFGVTNPSAVTSAGTGGPVSLLSSITGSNSTRQAAKLSNGNIVVVGFRITNPNVYCPVFTIYNVAGAVVVSETVISTTYTSGAVCSQIGTVALTGGGFAVFFLNGSATSQYSPCIAVYTNTGSVTTSIFADTPPGVGTSATTINGTALPNGGFALVYTNTATSQPITRAYNATGVAAYGWTSGSSLVYQPFINIGIAARSDNSTIIVWQQSTTVFAYVILNSSGGNIASSTFSPTIANNANQRSVDVSTLADGTTFVIGYNVNSSTNVYSCFRFLPTGNVLSSESYVPPLNVNTGFVGLSSMANQVRIQSLSSGGFVFFFTDSTQAWSYAFFNSSGVPVSGTSGNVGNGAVTRCLPFTYAFAFNGLAVVEIGGYINLYWSQGVNGQGAYFQQRVQIDSNTFNLVNATAYTETIGSTLASVNSYSKAASTPSGATFTATNTETAVLNKTYAITTPASNISSFACDGISAATFSNGNFVIGYRNSATYQVYFSVFSPSGGLLQTVLVGTGYPSSNYFSLKVAVLTSGKIVVGYHTASNVLTLALYAGSAGSFANTLTTTLSNVVTSDATIQYGIAGITNDRFVVAYRGPNNYPHWTVLDSTLSVVAGPLYPSGQPNTNNMSVAPLQGGGFVMNWWYNGSNKQIYIYKNDTGNTFTGVNGWGYSSDVTFQGMQVVATPNNYVYALGNSSSTAVSTQGWDFQQNSASGTSYTVSNCYGAFTAGLTGSGAIATIQLDSAGQYLWGTSFGTSAGTGTPQTASRLTLSGFSPYTSTAGPQVCTTAGIGNSIVIAFLNASAQPSFGIVSAIPASYTTNLIAGVTPSSPVPVSPSGSGLLTGYVFQGVSATSASAGGSGLVQTSGIAQLNSSYSASTAAGAFDYTMPNGSGIDGVKGTIVGRTVNLKGTV